MQTNGNSNDQDIETYRAEIARAFVALGGAMEVMQANLFITRALIDLLRARDLLQIGDVRERALVLAESTGVTLRTIEALRELLDENGLAVPQVLQ